MQLLAKNKSFKKSACCTSFALVLSTFCAPVAADPLAFLNQQNGRAAIDFSSRTTLTKGDDGIALILGLDTHRVFSRASGDIATLTLQPFLVFLDPSSGQRNSDGEVRDQTTFVDFRTSNLNVKLASRGALNLRLGHFEVPFALEHVIQNNGQLNTFNARSNAGQRADWGASFNGQAHEFEYEIGWLTGPTSSRGFWAGRIGRSSTNDLWYGVSGLTGDTNATARDSSEVVKRSRIGIDVGMNFLSGVQVLAELATGRDDGQRVTHALLETGYQSRTEAHSTYAQFRVGRFKEAGNNRDTGSVTLGYRFEPNTMLTGSLEYRHPLQANLEPSQLTAQLRLRI